MNTEEIKLDDTVPEEIFFMDGGWKIAENTAEAINDLLKLYANQGDIGYHVEWSPGSPLYLCVNFESMEGDIYRTKWVRPLEVVRDLLTEINS